MNFLCKFHRREGGRDEKEEICGINSTAPNGIV